LDQGEIIHGDVIEYLLCDYDGIDEHVVSL